MALRLDRMATATRPTSRIGRALGAVQCALAGVAAPIAAAACRALPILFGSLGIAGGAWLLDMALIAGPWQRGLLWSGAAALAVALFLAGARTAPACADHAGNMRAAPDFLAPSS